jgi:hypothetical protein
MLSQIMTMVCPQARAWAAALALASLMTRRRRGEGVAWRLVEALLAEDDKPAFIMTILEPLAVDFEDCDAIRTPVVQRLVINALRTLEEVMRPSQALLWRDTDKQANFGSPAARPGGAA